MASNRLPNHATSEATNLFETRSSVWNTIFSFIRSMSLACAAELGVFDAIHRHSGSPITIPVLLAELGLPPSRSLDLARLLRLLEHNGFFASQTVDGGASDEKTYVLTPSGRHVQEGAALIATTVAIPDMILPWLRLSSWFRSDEPTAFHAEHGMSMWEYASRSPEFNNKFNAGMTYDSDVVAQAILANCGPVLERVRSLLDVGGNNGRLARAITEAFPRIKCTVLDLPHVVAGQQSTERVEFLAGNMFDFVPRADVVLLKNILHDYNDEDCLRILSQCQKAIKSKDEGGKIIVLDIVLNVTVKENDGTGIENQLFMDLMMMEAMPGGREREEHEWNNLLVQAGFSGYKITPILDMLCLIEVYP